MNEEEVESRATTRCPRCRGEGLARSGRPWPGHCQQCGERLGYPEATWCRSCGSSDYDEGPPTPYPCPVCDGSGSVSTGSGRSVGGDMNDDELCPTCQGSGVRDMDEHPEWHPCPDCQGTGLWRHRIEEAT